MNDATSREPSERLLRAILGFVAALLALSVVLQNPGGQPAFFEPGAVFHYYLGAKYMNEIGPFDFYACAVAADAESETIQTWQAETPVRDLRTYALAPAGTLHCPRDRFTPQRWSAFVHDVSWVTATAAPSGWDETITDKGYNATPFLSVVFGRLAAVVPIDRWRARFLLFNLDMLFVAIAIGIVWSSAGATIALLTLLLCVGYFGNFGRIGGNFGQYAWFPCLALAVAAWRARRPALGGGALGLAAGLQAFPVLLAIPIVIGGVRAVCRRDRDGWKRTVMFFASLAVALGCCVAVGSTSARGPAAWQEWREKIAVHSSYLRGEVFDIGLPNLIADIVSSDRASSESYTEDTPHSAARNAALGTHVRLWRFCAVVLILLTCAAAWCVPEEALFACGFVPIYALLALSPYYYFALALLPFMAVGMARSQWAILVGLLVIVLGVHLAMWGGSYISFVFARHFAGAVLIASFMTLTALVPLGGRVFGARTNADGPGCHV